MRSQAAGPPGSPKPTKETPLEKVDPSQVSYAQRVGMAFVAFIQFYMFMHSDHGVPAKTLGFQARSKKGDEAVALAITMQRAMLALIGTHRCRTYAHDLVYGTWQLYVLFAKPWNAATEGNEHAHQDMKAFFHGMVCHSNKAHSDCYAVLRLSVVKREMLHTNWHLLPNSNYAAMRANHTLQEKAEKKEGKKRGKDSGPKGLKMYTEDTAMQRCARLIQAEIVDELCVDADDE